MDMTGTIAPRSDQMNAEDLLSGPRTFTVARVRVTEAAEQPVSMHLAEFPDDRPFKPSKTVRRLLVVAWGPDSAAYVGQRLTLYRDPHVKWAGAEVGGIRVSHMSGISKRISVALTETRGKRVPYVVDPLPDEPAAPDGITRDQLATLNAALKAAGITQRDAALGYYAQVVGRPVAATKDLTRDEASAVIDALQADAAGGDGDAEDALWREQAGGQP